MPRPTLAQLVYGSATVTLTTLLLLLLTQAQSGTTTVLIASGALVAGLLVSLLAPAGRRTAAPTGLPVAGSVPPIPEQRSAPPASGAPAVGARVPQPSFRR
ncbi:hypothetical protein QNO07_10235 [Streptomyces sp. 549]|uniref:hypothetical protein n=1 Tax=Streptomyces sp. 549 TaxID=3049076 RepID=UPI0024C27790|nr:hypothetical protein [Streptomyces sp. 549]MDK1473793.1 hypothetical protein [Streptomyces sp. 549]